MNDESRMATASELETLSMFESLPQDPEWLAEKERQKQLRQKLKEERTRFQNVFSTQLNRLMNHFKIEASPLAKATNTPESTLHGWINFITDSQDLSSQVKAIANHFGVTVDYLAFGIPVTDRDLELEDAMPEIDIPTGEIA